jgi:hypothetical protein
LERSIKKYGLAAGAAAAVIVILAVAYTLPMSQPSAKARQLGLTADNFFKIRVGENAPFFAAGRGGVKPYQFTWDFGDGSQSQLQNATHVYSDEGTYRVRLTIKDSAGATEQVSHTVDVYPANANFTRPDDILRR